MTIIIKTGAKLAAPLERLIAHANQKMKKQHVGSSQSLATSPSPEAAGITYHHHHHHKGWSSERVPPPSSTTNTRRNNRRLPNSALTTPFYKLPSKWEDAERWICSPVLGYGVSKNVSYTHQRRPMSKSGPILPPELVSSSSPFTTGVLMMMPCGVGESNDNVIGGDAQVDYNEPRSSSLPAWSDLVSDDPSLPTSRDEKLEDINDEENTVTRVVSRRDMATQMSPQSSSNSSLGGRSPSPPSILPIVELESDQNAKVDIREVQVDKRATIVSWSKKHSSCMTTEALPYVDGFNRNLKDGCSWDISEAASDFSKLQREEAKITTWENLQKAKAEAAIRKLEMKLEKKRASSMDKILNKLKLAQSRAQEMRSSMTDREVLETSKRLQRITFSRERSLFCSLQSCFTSQAF